MVSMGECEYCGWPNCQNWRHTSDDLKQGFWKMDDANREHRARIRAQKLGYALRKHRGEAIFDVAGRVDAAGMSLDDLEDWLREESESS